MVMKDTNHLVNRPIGEISIQSLVQLLSCDGSNYQYEALVRISKITDSEQIKMMVEAGAIQNLVRLLSSNDSQIQLFTASALSKILC